MTDTLRKRAERQRRREAGEVRVEVWLDEPTLARLDMIAGQLNVQRSSAVETLIWREK